MNKKAVFSLRIAGILARKGFKLVEKQPNFHNPKLFVYFFENTPELEEALESEIQTLRNKRDGEA